MIKRFWIVLVYMVALICLTSQTFAGGIFRVETSTLGKDNFPNVTGLSDGGFLVTWYSTVDLSIHGQRYDAAGSPAGSELNIFNNPNGVTSGLGTSVAGLSGGGFVVTWRDPILSGQLFAADGTPIGSNFQIDPTGFARSSSVASLTDGGFIVVWASSSGNVVGERYDAAGAPIGGNFQLNTHPVLHTDLSPSVTGLTDGGFVSTWNSIRQNYDEDIYGQRYTAAGVRTGPEFQVNTTVAETQENSSVAGLARGGFVVTWSSGGGVRARRYNARGQAVGGEFTGIPQAGNLGMLDPKVAGFRNGNYVVVAEGWGASGTPGGYAIWGQRFNFRGGLAGAEFPISKRENAQSMGAASVANLTSGGFVVIWVQFQRGGKNRFIYGRVYYR